MAASLQVRVEGSFLRIIQKVPALQDRKLHFRAIVDYATVEGSLMRRFGIMTLQMTTTAGGAASTIRIDGLRDCTKVRDMLAEIDSIREK
jgi:putative N-acetylmannosamine-6-phosphate epimerase